MRTALRMRLVAPSATLGMAAKAADLRRQGKAILDLSAGEPDFNTPQHIKDAAKKAIDDNFTRYTPVPGIPTLREAVTGYYKKIYGVPVPKEAVIATNGGKQALYNLFLAVLNPGDEVLVPAPYWVSYPDMIRLAGGEPVAVPSSPENGFLVTVEDLDRAATPATRAMVLNSPSNPTGAHYTAEQLDAIMDWAVSRGIYIVSDEIYDRLVYDPAKPASMAGCFAMYPENVAVVGGLAKSFAMTGWRMGYCIAHPDVIRAMSTLQSQSTSNICSIVQKAAIAALTGPLDCVEEMRQAFARRRDLCLSIIKTWDKAFCPVPAGAFYLFPSLAGYYNEAVPNSTALSEALLTEAGIATVPGVAFGEDRCVRLSYATSDEILEKALTKMGDFLKKLGQRDPKPETPTAAGPATGRREQGVTTKLRKDDDQSLGFVKFLSWSSLALILLVNLFLSIFLSNYARQDVLAKQKEFALLLAENLNHQIYQRFTLPTVIGFGRVELSQPAQYDRLDKTVLSTIHSFHVSEVRIYDHDKRVSYSTDKELVGQSGFAGAAILEALEQGTSSFQVVTRAGMFGGIFDFSPKPDTVTLKTIYPLRTERSLVPGNPQGFIMGVLEFTQDITDDYQKVVDFQRIIIATSLMSSFLLFVMLRIIISRAGRINAQRIADRERLERELQQQEKLAGMGRMVAGIAHEIRNPLGIIRSTAELLLKRAKDADPANARLLSAIFDESKRLSKTVGDFLDYARPKNPRQDEVDLALICDQALTFLEAKCEELGIVVSRDYAPGLTVRGDKDLLYRAVYNVLSNALDAMAEDKEKLREPALAVAAVRDGDELTLTIADTGPGFCPDNKDRVLDPFFTTKDAGTGLGLAIVRTIVESHNAALALDNAPDGGARVTMTFTAA